MAEAFGHHLHTAPLPPSQRTNNLVPDELERLVLACLSKKVEDRPQSARALHHDLSQLAATWSWTSDDASTWWRAFRASDFQPSTESGWDAVAGFDTCPRGADCVGGHGQPRLTPRRRGNAATIGTPCPPRQCSRSHNVLV